MNAKNIMNFILAAMIVISLVPMATAISQFPDIVVTMINQEPDPVAPGTTVDVRFRIENQGSNPANEVQAKLILDYPFSLYGGEESIKNLGAIEGNQIGDIGIREKWKLLADSKAITGDHVIEFWYKVSGGEWTKGGDFTVSVRTREAVLAINQIKTDQDTISPGTKTKVSFFLENLADNNLRDIKLNLGIYTELATAASITFRELPFTPLGSSNEKTLKSLSAGETKEITFDLFTDADAVSKVYKVPYTLTFSDASGTNFTTSGVVGLLVDSDPQLSVNLEKTEIYSAGAKGTVEFKLVNKGFSDIKFLDVTLNPSDDYDIISNPEVYIGKLDSDDYDTASYTIMVNGKAKDSVSLKLQVEYRDSNGHIYSKEIPTTLKLYSGAELKKRTNGTSSSGWVIPVIIVVAVVGFFVYRRIKKNKKK